MEKIKFTPISLKDMLAKHMDDYFWYVLDLSFDPPIVVANPYDDGMVEFTFIFQEQEDARHWAFLISKTPAHQDHKLGIQSDKFQPLLLDCQEEGGRYILAAFSHEEAQKLFENYKEYIKLSEAEKRDYLKALTKELRERIMTHLTRDDLFSDPESRTDASAESEWVFQVNSGFFSPSEGQFSYEGEVYFIKEVDRDASTGDMWVLICIKI